MSPDTAIPGLKVDGHSLIRFQRFSIDVLCREQVLGVDAVGLVERNLPVLAAIMAGSMTPMHSFMGSSLRTPAALMMVRGMFYSPVVKKKKSNRHAGWRPVFY